MPNEIKPIITTKLIDLQATATMNMIVNFCMNDRREPISNILPDETRRSVICACYQGDLIAI